MHRYTYFFISCFILLILMMACNLLEAGLPTPTTPSEDDPSPPAFTTLALTQVRVGPGFEYELYFEIGAGTSGLVLGRSADSNWLAIQGPGDGSGPPGWVNVAAVALSGDLTTVPVLSAPSLPNQPAPGDVPLIVDPGSPPSQVCVVDLPAGSPPVDVFLGPGEQFALIARLGGWAEVLSSAGDWRQVLLGPGLSGWVSVNQVVLSGPCSELGGEPCLVEPVPGTQPPNVHLGPGDHFGLAGVLNAPAEVLSSEMGWYHIQLGPGETGWVQANRVTLSGACENR
jgi:uncharacterized protein YraI